MRIFFLIFYLLIGNLLFAQQGYDLLYLKGDYNAILDKCQKLETQEDYYWSSIIINKQGNTLEAIKILQNGIIEFDSINILETLLSDFLYKTGQYSEAKPLLALQSNNPLMFIKYINVLEFQGEYDLAIEFLKKELLKDSLNLVYLTHLGEDYFKVDSLELAIEVFSKVLTINPNNQLIALKLANLLIKSKDYSKAVEICEIGLTADSTHKKLIKTKGIASFNIADFHTSEDCFTYLLTQGDSNKFVLKHLGLSMFNNNSFNNSRETLIQAYVLDSNDLEICYMLGKCYLNSPQPAKGLYFFDRVDSLLQPDPMILSALYREKQSIYSILDRHEEALLWYKKAYSYNPKPEYVFYIASVYQNKLNKQDSALINYERFLRLLAEQKDTLIDSTQIDKKSIVLKNIAENNIEQIKETLFFEGKLK